MAFNIDSKKANTLSNTLFISIIIPTYNVEKYITRCLESCINQTFSNIEILVVDDCGNDNSINIAQDFANKDSRIRIIHNSKNLGTFNARIEGIKNAKGEYILCLDADDYIDTKCCEILHNTIMQEQDLPDIVMFKAYYKCSKCIPILELLKHKSRYILPTQFHSKPLNGTQIAHNFFLSSYHFPKFTLWDKIYKRSLLEFVNDMLVCIDRPIVIAEDMLKFFVISSLATRCISINERLYVYCYNPHSATNDKSSIDKKIHNLSNVEYCLDIISKNDDLASLPLTAQIVGRMKNYLESIKVLEHRYSANCREWQKILPPYLYYCLQSLKYWNRILTYMRIIVYILSFGKIKL